MRIFPNYARNCRFCLKSADFMLKSMDSEDTPVPTHQNLPKKSVDFVEICGFPKLSFSDVAPLEVEREMWIFPNFAGNPQISSKICGF